jgi:hypothetical protein
MKAPSLNSHESTRRVESICCMFFGSCLIEDLTICKACDPDNTEFSGMSFPKLR